MRCCLILAGGSGKRLGRNKALLEIGGRKIIDIQIDKLSAVFDEFLIVTSSENHALVKHFERDGVRVISENEKGKGPLGGILSGLEASRFDKNFVLACDMPFINKDAVLYVLSKLDKGNCAVALPVTPKGPEPLFAAYRKTCIPAIKDEILSGSLKVTGFIARVSVCQIASEEIAAFDPRGLIFMNINTEKELFEAENIMGKHENS